MKYYENLDCYQSFPYIRYYPIYELDLFVGGMTNGVLVWDSTRAATVDFFKSCLTSKVHVVQP